MKSVILRSMFGWGIVFWTTALIKYDGMTLYILACLGGLLIGIGAWGWEDTDGA